MEYNYFYFRSLLEYKNYKYLYNIMSEETPHYPRHGVVQLPNGELQYFATEIKDRHNPYLDHQIDEENGIEYSEIVCNGERMIIPSANIQYAIALEWRASTIRLLCLLDMFLNSTILFTTDWDIIYGIICTSISLSGYISTITYSRSGLLFYLIYQYIQTVSKLTITTYYIGFSTTQYLYTRDRIERTNNFSFEITMILIITTLGQIYINYFVQAFYNMLPRQSNQINREIHSTI